VSLRDRLPFGSVNFVRSPSSSGQIVLSFNRNKKN
jgi:hypothetical protein